jgi:REP element-mobilizing transposase RayT
MANNIFIENLQKRQGAYLPHWTANGARYFVTFRLAASFPSSIWKEIAQDYRDILQTAAHTQRPLTSQELEELEELHFRKLDLLRSERDACYLKDDRIAQIVANALKHFDGERYVLFAWVVMPNHVHVVLRPLLPWKLPNILHSWKSFTAQRANKILNRRGEFWQREYYDHLIPNDNELQRCIEYTWSNPEKDGLKNWKWKWKTDGSTEIAS